MIKIIRAKAVERAYSFLENNLSVGYFALMIAAAGIGIAYAKFEALTASVTP